MASTIKVNNIQNQCGANIANKCGSTITLGASGDTITLACGASQTGFGRTGTVDWDTTAKTASFTAVSGNGYFVNTTSGAITVTLPASPSAGDIVSLSDYTNTWQTNAVIVGRNSQPIGGIAADAILSTEGQSVTFIYVDGTEGWKNVQDSTSNVTGNSFISATGGTITTCGNYKIHTFTGPGTFTVSNLAICASDNNVDYLVVAGGASGGNGSGGGGGGAGGYRESSGTASGCYTASPLGACVSALPVTVQGYPITVGAGGAPLSLPITTRGNSGSNSIFSTITSAGGGGGGSEPAPLRPANSGGSGGGGQGHIPTGSPGSGNTPPVSPPQGNDGGSGGGQYNGGGGGGAGSAGATGGPGPGASSGGNGGTGATSSINGTPTARAGGGGGGGQPGPGGSGQAGGGDGNQNGVSFGSPATANSGSGGGGGGFSSPSFARTGAGGSGIVIIRYKYQ